jgi:hypothetical protein
MYKTHEINDQKVKPTVSNQLIVKWIPTQKVKYDETLVF